MFAQKMDAEFSDAPSMNASHQSVAVDLLKEKTTFGATE